MSFKVIIHVGPPKTGSTALQFFLAANRQQLEDLGIVYPIGVVENIAHFEIPAFVSGSPGIYPALNEVDIHSIISGYFEEATMRKADTLLLSSENFSTLSRNSWANLIEQFRLVEECEFELIFFDFQIETRLASHIYQYIRHGEFVDQSDRQLIEEIVSKITPDFEVATENLGFKISRVSYPENSDLNLLFLRFLDALALSKSKSSDCVWKFPKTKANQLLPNNYIEILNQFNRLNSNGKQFEAFAPIFFSGLYPTEKARLELFFEQINKLVAQEVIIQELKEQLKGSITPDV